MCISTLGKREAEVAIGLEGIKVIQTATVLAGPMAARLLADWGADVITVEPLRGALSRAPSDRVASKTGKAVDIDAPYENVNRNKRGITIDLSQQAGREIIFRLLNKADVFIANFRPRELEKFQLDYGTLSRLNPRLIQANITGYGRKGPDRDLPAFAALGFCRAGLQHLMKVPGMEPMQIPGAVPDILTGLALCYGIMTALVIRERTGIAQEIDTSLFRTGVFALTSDIGKFLVDGQEQAQVSRKDFTNPLRNFYQTKDGRWLRLAMVIHPEMWWSSLCCAIERKDIEHDRRFESFELRTENYVALTHILDQAFLGKTLNEWRIRLKDSGIPWSPLQNLTEVTTDPQARANDFFIPFNHPTYGHMELVANPVSLSKTPETIRIPAPGLSQHTEEVLLEHGYTLYDIARLRKKQIIA